MQGGVNTTTNAPGGLRQPDLQLDHHFQQPYNPGPGNMFQDTYNSVNFQQVLPTPDKQFVTVGNVNTMPTRRRLPVLLFLSLQLQHYTNL
mmetsp:Transcript_25674/g.48182  ORF Transcript_25674/g.48182 Transcript_25674/m.48182 type:complete len:90 (+) Transcript_25674:356-625(+)